MNSKELHLSILGPRDFYCLISKNHVNDKVERVWLEKTKVIPYVHRKNEEGYTCWISLNDKEKNNDTTEGVKTLCVLWFDIDSNRKNKNVPATKEELQDALFRTVRLKNYIEKKYNAWAFTANSGNGFHIFFPLPLHPLNNVEERKKTNDKLRLFAKALATKCEVEIDHTYDLRRVTTLIESLNLKLKNVPLETHWNKEIFDSKNVLRDVEKAREANTLLLEAILNVDATRKPSPTTIRTKNKFEFTLLLKKDPKLKDLYFGEWQKFGYKSRSEAEEALLIKLVQYGFTDNDLTEIMEKSQIGKWNEAGDSYRKHSLENAQEYTEELKKERKDWFKIDTRGNIRFSSIKFAKYLMDNYHFKTTRDNETLYVFNWNKGIYEDWGEIFVREQIVNELDEDTKEHYQRDILFFIKGSTYFDRIHNPLGKIAVENGYLDIETLQVEPYNPDLFITTRIPVAYDQKATCPKILKFLEEVVSQDQMHMIQEFFGYCLYKAMPFHKALMLVGDGANGKSTLLELLKKLLGADNVNNATLQGLCYSRFATANLYGRLANICADIPNDALKRTGTFKMLVGGDTINAQQKFKTPFNFKNHAKLIFSANNVPDTQDDTLAFFRRWIIIICNNIFIGKKCNPHILKEISSPKALSGLLNFALEGLTRILKNGKFSTTETMEELRNQYIRRSNSAKAFIEESIKYDPNPNKIITTTQMYKNYIDFCTTNNLHSMKKRIFTINMQQYLSKVTQTQRRIDKKTTWVWQNVTSVTSSSSNYRLTNNPEVNGKTTLPNLKVEKKGDNHDVTDVTLDCSLIFANVCAICKKRIPEGLEHCTTWEGKYVHIECYRNLVKGRKEDED